MKFLYEYRTSDNAKHSGVIRAADREAAYAALKSQGIKPSRFSEAPGLVNKVFGKGKRWIAIAVLAVVAIVSTTIALHRAPGPAIASLDSEIRRQPYGDLVLIDKGIRTGWAEVFALPGERFLASFAIPGAVPAVTTATDAELQEALATPCDKANPSEGIEVRQVRAMVEGLKTELREYLADGGTYAKYMRRLVRRQTEEISYAKRVEGEVTQALKGGMPRREAEELLERRNAQLRALGIRTVFLPDSEGGKIF